MWPARLEFIKRWSPAVLPPLVGILLLLLALVFASQSGIVGAPSVSPTVLIELLAIYLVLGMVWGFTLYLATDTLRWLLVVLGGLVSYLVVTASVYWGMLGGAILVVLIAALCAWYARRHTQSVPAGSATITTLAGAYLRTLPPGVWALAPRERVHTTLEIRDQTIICAPVELHLLGEDGQPMIARAAAKVGFRLSTASAHHAVLAPEEWTRELRAVAAATLEQSLDEWARLPQRASAASPAEQLGAIYQRDLVERTGEFGLRHITVNVQDAALESEGESEGDAMQPDRANITQPIVPAPPHAETMAVRSSTQPLRVPETPAQPAPSTGAAAGSLAPPPLPDALDPAVLKTAYQAVADQRITDPTTIRAIADAFATIARDPVRVTKVDFDAERAARILMGLAAKLEGQRKH